jgi:hypothetical protein
VKKPVKIAWGIATLLPVVFVIGGFVAFFVFLIPNLTAKGGHPSDLPVNFFAMIFSFYGLFLLGILMGFLVHISYFVHLVRADQLNKDFKTLWAVMFLVLNILAMIVYWFIVVWPEPEKGKNKRE